MDIEKLLAPFVFSTSLASCNPDYSIVTSQELVTTYDDDECVWVDSFTQQEGTTGTDIVWVIDKSGSMVEETDKTLEGIHTMMNNLPQYGWQLNMIAIHPNAAYDQHAPLTPGATYEDLEELYSSMSRGSVVEEKGFEALMVYIDENSFTRTWMRENASLLAVFASDEDDESFEEQDLSNEESVDRFVSWYETKRDTVDLASIVITDTPCGSDASERGERYIQATDYFNGALIDFCNASWASGVRDVANAIEPYGYWQFSKTPMEETIVIFVDDKYFPRVDENGQEQWFYEENARVSKQFVIFNTIPEVGSKVTIGYNVDLTTTNNVCPSQ